MDNAKVCNTRQYFEEYVTPEIAGQITYELGKRFDRARFDTIMQNVKEKENKRLMKPTLEFRILKIGFIKALISGVKRKRMQQKFEDAAGNSEWRDTEITSFK
jgi:hypothetical protein